jgi:SAM-dependent methyltransferase
VSHEPRPQDSGDRDHGRTHGHAAPEHAHAPDGRDWAERAARLELEGEVGLPLVHEAIDAVTSRVASPDDIRVVLDLGSGPGVASVVLAERFPSAAVKAVDASGSLLDLVTERAARFGVSERVTTRVADLEQPLDDIAPGAAVDLVWASMVLHHLAALPRTLVEVHGLLTPAGLLAIVEFGNRSGPLPAGFDVGRDGFAERLAEARLAAIEDHLPPGALALDWPALIERAGFDLLDQRALALELPAPLGDPPRRLVHQQLAGSARMTEGRLDDADREILAALVDVDDSRCVLHRDDLAVEISRTFFLARRRCAGAVTRPPSPAFIRRPTSTSGPTRRAESPSASPSTRCHRREER